MAENVAFTERAIAKAQRVSIETMECQAINDYLTRQRRMTWDEARGLFWVNHPSQGPQVAVWMMPVALVVSPQAEGHE